MDSGTSKEISQAPSTPINSGTATEKPKCKACCACPETKRARDQCIVERGEENCSALIEAHKICMRSAGFNI
ncbi:cytochrome c oxidase copper chaperone-like [Scaptodrosophila lebanonensis]|uniref:Cytochrome c oxidase copper chaperone n=1 Tax=Drosophila lebanonensis TaxID=7225 RepID=A0A6J2T7Y9_DROLE|nr:cytochrome c oxidase copper chaperone-like [Scaptodrosophila lebanonensis]